MREQRIGWAADYYYRLLTDRDRTDVITADSVIGFVSEAAILRSGLEIPDLLEARVRAFLRYAGNSPRLRIASQSAAMAVRTGKLSLYFGPQWDTLGFGAVQVPLPVGHSCFYCDEPVVAGDRGLLIPVMTEDSADTEPVHLECELRATVGHHLEVCWCTGYGFDQRARDAISLAVNAQRADQGYGPL